MEESLYSLNGSNEELDLPWSYVRVSLAGFGVNPMAFAHVAQPHTIILSASARSRCFLMMTLTNAASAAATTPIHIRDLMGMPP
jgi:hypothetical protein